MNKRMVWLVVGMVVLSGLSIAQARTLIGGRGIPVVSDPKDLNLVNLKPISEYLYSDLKNKGEFGVIRRTALNMKAGQYGVPDPRHKMLFGGMVIGRGSSGNASTILVMMGDLKFKDIRGALEKDYREYMETTRGTPKISNTDVGGVNFETFSYAERPYDVCVAQLKDKKTIVVASVPKEDLKLLEDTVRVVQGQEALNETEPTDIEAETTLSLTQRELERLVKFNRPKGNLRGQFAKGMKSIAQKLGIPHSDDETVPLDERIRGQLALSKQISAKYKWDVDSSKASAYSVQYTIQMKDKETAEVLRGLISEQIVRLSETVQHTGDKDSYGRLTVSANDAEVQVNFLLDSPEAQYQHTSLLLSQVLRYRSVFSFLDRNGQSAAGSEE